MTAGAIWKLTFGVAALIVALGFLLQAISPASGRLFAIAAFICALATWLAPMLLFAFYWYQDLGGRRPPSLVSVGRSISLIFNAAIFSVIGLSFAAAPLISAPNPYWARLALLVIVTFWALGILMLVLFDKSGSRGVER